MKLECQVVRDIYPLYEEGELSPEVKEAVDSHLLECTDCYTVFSNETGFNELLTGKTVTESLPKQLDDKIRLRFRLKRMTFIAILLLTVIIVSAVKDYMGSRDHIANAYHSLYLLSEFFSQASNEVKTDQVEKTEFLTERLFSIVEGTRPYEENLNFLERHQLKNSDYWLYLNQGELVDMLKILHLRHVQNDWNEQDEAAFDRLNAYFADYHKFVSEEYEEFHHGYSSYFVFSDTERLSGLFEKINNLSFYYNRFHKLPEDVRLKGKEELTVVLQEAFNIKNGEVDLQETSPLNEAIGVYQYSIKDSNKEFSGKIDGFTGQIIKGSLISHRLTEGKLIEQTEARIKAISFLEGMYGNGNVNLVLEGMNYNVSSNVDLQVYSYSFIPVSGNKELHLPYEAKYLIHIDARTGELFSFHSPLFFSSAFVRVQTEEMSVDKHMALKKFNPENEGVSVTYEGLGIIWSMYSGTYAPVHILKSENGEETETVYINSTTGLIDIPYVRLN